MVLYLYVKLLANRYGRCDRRAYAGPRIGSGLLPKIIGLIEIVCHAEQAELTLGALDDVVSILSTR